MIDAKLLQGVKIVSELTNIIDRERRLGHTIKSIEQDITCRMFKNLQCDEGVNHIEYFIYELENKVVDAVVEILTSHNYIVQANKMEDGHCLIISW
jgi:hypothetical protein